MARSDGARVLSDRHRSVAGVLRRVLVLNLLVAVAKIALGMFSGAVSILSDGFHSLADASANVVALVGVAAAQRPADENHPYGHRKYETMASLGILIPTFLEQLRSAIGEWTFWVGIIKAPFFAVVISLVGCYEGFNVARSADSVGRLTTQSVVESIFIVIVADAAFSIMFSMLHI